MSDPPPAKECPEAPCLWCALLTVHKALGAAYVNTVVPPAITWNTTSFWSGA